MKSVQPAMASERRSGMLEDVMQAVRAGDMTLAQRLACERLAGGLEHPLLLNLRALEYEGAGRFEDALADLQRAHILAPGDFSILNACGLILGRLGRIEEAAGCFRQALEIEPRFAPARFNLGWACEQLGALVQAADAYRATVELAPQHVQAWANLAWLAGRRGDAQAARGFADKALALQPGQPTALLALAASGLAPATAETQMRQLLKRPELSPHEQGLSWSLLGDALDAQDRCAEAFAAYRSSNETFRAEASGRFEAPGQLTVSDALNWLIAWAKVLKAGAWPAADGRPHGAGVREHVFLMGFPRSGTTLVESALTAHPAIVSLEERDAMQLGVKEFMGDANALSRLGRLSESELEPYRADYWRQVHRYGIAPEGKVFIDKNPFHTLKLPLIARLFPNAKIIFAVRDPRDVTLSCFRRRFSLNASTYELLDLRRAAVFYVGAMQLAELLRGKAPMNEHRLVFERLLADFTGETRALCEFIGAEWRPELADFAGRAQRGGVASASSAQIARGLNSDGAGQWRRYRPQLEPVLDILQPWVKRFDYPAD